MPSDVGKSGFNPPNWEKKEAGVVVGGGGKRFTTLLGDEAATGAGFTEAIIGVGVPLDVGSFRDKSSICENQKPE